MKTYKAEMFNEQDQTLTMPPGRPKQDYPLDGEGVMIEGSGVVYTITAKRPGHQGAQIWDLRSIGVQGVSSGQGPTGEGIPAPAYGGFVQATNVETIHHPDIFSDILRVWREEDDELLAAHVTWKKVKRNEKAPEETNICVTKESLQNLFDSLWRRGLRPTGTTVTLEEVKVEGVPQEYHDSIVEKCREFNEYWKDKDLDNQAQAAVDQFRKDIFGDSSQMDEAFKKNEFVHDGH